MPIDAALLLKKLEPPVRPVATGAAQRGAAPFEAQGFSDLLALVSRGGVHSGRLPSVAPDADLAEPLEAPQLERLAAAADLAEAAGAARAVMLIDGRGLVLDVADRVVRSELRGTESAVLDVDVAVHVAATDAAAPALIGPPRLGTGLVPPGVARQLSEDNPARAARRAG